LTSKAFYLSPEQIARKLVRVSAHQNSGKACGWRWSCCASRSTTGKYHHDLTLAPIRPEPCDFAQDGLVAGGVAGVLLSLNRRARTLIGTRFESLLEVEELAYSKAMFGLGVGELLIILVIVLIIFGAGKLPEIGEGLGKGIRNFRKSVKAPDEIDVTPEQGSTERPEKKP
jgi:sec-independent protein translocase protein TatA